MTDPLIPSGAVPPRRSLSRPALVLFGLLSAACGSGHERPPPAPGDGDNGNNLSNYDSSTGDSRDAVAAGECENGAKQTCRVYLPAHDGIQPCFVGEQTCVEEHWSACDDAVLVDANAGDTSLDSGDTSTP